MASTNDSASGPRSRIGVDALGRHDVADDAVQVGAGLLRGVAHAVAAQHLVVGDPDAAAGARGRPAVVGRLLDDDGAQAVTLRGQRGRHPGRAAAHDDDVEHLVRHVEQVIVLPDECATRTALRSAHVDENTF